MTNIDIKERYNKSPALDVLDDIKNINLFTKAYPGRFARIAAELVKTRLHCRDAGKL